MKKLFTQVVLATSIFGASSAPVFALTITFNDTAADGSFTSHGTNAMYSESGMTFSAKDGTRQFSNDPAYDPILYTSVDDTDFQSFESGTPTGWIVSAPLSRFTLTSFDAAAVGGGSCVLTLTGHFIGGGTIVEVINLPAHTGVANWITHISPAGWDNLTSVDFNCGDSGQVGIDNMEVVLTEPIQISIEDGYMKLDNINGTILPDSHCAAPAHEGRMILDSANGLIYVCTQAGWATTTLTPVVP